jgi:hypothetical protein
MFEPGGAAYGYRVALNSAGDRLFAATPWCMHNGAETGAVWVVSDLGTPNQSEVELVPPDTLNGLQFGYSIATNDAGDILIVGADGSGPAATWPRVYFYRLNGTAWEIEHVVYGNSGEHIGFSAAATASGDRVAIGVPFAPNPFHLGIVHIFRREPTGWRLEATLQPAATNDILFFGNYLALSPDGRWLAGRSFAPYLSPVQSGAIYMFERTGTTWTERVMLQEPVGYSSGGFGLSLEFDGASEMLVVGNPDDSRLSLNRHGAVTIFRNLSSGWQYDTALLPSLPTVFGRAGTAVEVSASGERIWMGITGQDLGTLDALGAVEEFELTSNGWQSLGLRTAPTPQSAGFFGGSLAVVPTGRRWVARDRSDVHGPDFGQVHVFDAPCLTTTVYCTAQTSSNGCVPQIGSQGTPSVSAGSGFSVTLTSTRNQQSGLLFYGTNGRTTLPWFGGTLCVQPPLVRTPLMQSGGSPPPAVDCSGAFTRDFNALVATSADPALFPGQHVRCQYYGRDPAAATHVNLSDALEFYLEP